MNVLKHICFFPLKVKFRLFTQSCLTICNPIDFRTPGFLLHHKIPQFTQTHVYRVGAAIQQTHPLSSPSPLAFNLSEHQGLFKQVSASHQVA